MKPEYEKAAEKMKSENIPGVLAALVSVLKFKIELVVRNSNKNRFKLQDATKEPEIAGKFGVKGYPSVKFFSYGEFKFDANVRDMDKIIEFMRNPTEPPPPPPPEKNWDEEETHVVHLDDESFKPFLKKKKHALVMFYAPCKFRISFNFQVQLIIFFSNLKGVSTARRLSQNLRKQLKSSKTIHESNWLLSTVQKCKEFVKLTKCEATRQSNTSVT